jgi:hypothetical protein
MTPDRIFGINRRRNYITYQHWTDGCPEKPCTTMTALDIGVMLIRTRMEWTSIALLGGFALIKQNKVTVLVNQAETHATIDPEQAEKTYQEAQRQWVEAVGAKKGSQFRPQESTPDCNWSKPSNSTNKDYHR